MWAGCSSEEAAAQWELLCYNDGNRTPHAEQHLTRRSGGLHALSHPDLLTDSGVSEWPRADFTGDHLAGVQPDAHPQRNSSRSTWQFRWREPSVARSFRNSRSVFPRRGPG
jgi:hypothetical protein